MPKLERLEWVEPLSAGRGVTLTEDDEANRLLGADPFALLLGVLCDSQFQTKRAFAIPLRLKERLGHLNVDRIATEPEAVREAFTVRPALHRFPNRCAELTTKLAAAVVSDYNGHAETVWVESANSSELAVKLMALPAFGQQKTDWTIGMLGRMGVITFPDWDGYRVASQ